MALTRTTLSSAVVVADTSIVVASATGFAADRIVRIDQEFMVVQKSYSSGTTIPVRRGQLGTKNVAHVASAGVVVGTAADDWDAPGVAAVVNNPTAGRPRIIESITADNSTVTHSAAGTDHVVILNGTSVINLTVPVPTTDMDGDELNILANGTAAHVITFTGGIGGEGSSYDVITSNANGPVAYKFVACNAVWLAYCQPAMTGTVTNLVGGIA
ncbi:hypothetical protein [Longimicrobium sp.]|uniref:hypothetical protein n=1 Tax=Longimicrobium sp. TaxID=2029185 RepID=UPI002E30A865|nr:hypothetical protein [Longimicrobium sp.]HEX6038911.1 hypothetical protein [Longimicrobium sp.]